LVLFNRRIDVSPDDLYLPSFIILLFRSIWISCLVVVVVVGIEEVKLLLLLLLLLQVSFVVFFHDTNTLTQMTKKKRDTQEGLNP
jgi:hypothetical protein